MFKPKYALANLLRIIRVQRMYLSGIFDGTIYEMKEAKNKYQLIN